MLHISFKDTWWDFLFCRKISNEVTCSPRDQRKGRHFGVRCYIQISPHFQFVSSPLTAYLCSETFLKSVNELLELKYSSPSCCDINSAKLCVVEIPNSGDFFRRKCLFPVQIARNLKFCCRNVGRNPDTKISGKRFISTNYQRSQNWQSHSINRSTCEKDVTEVKR